MMNDLEIINLIRSKKLEKPVKELYKHFPQSRLTLLKYGANDEQIQEIYNDALVILIEKVTPTSFQLSAKLSTFLIGICINIYRNQARKQVVENKYELMSDNMQVIEETDENAYDFEREVKLNLIEEVLETIQEKCKQLLRLFYFNKSSMQEIADKMGFSSTQSAKTQKYKCLERAHMLAQTKLVELKNVEL